MGAAASETTQGTFDSIANQSVNLLQERPSGTVILKILQKEIYNSVDCVLE